MHKVNCKFLVHFFWHDFFLLEINNFDIFEPYDPSKSLCQVTTTKSMYFKEKQEMIILQCFTKYFFLISPSTNTPNGRKLLEVRTGEIFVCLFHRTPLLWFSWGQNLSGIGDLKFQFFDKIIKFSLKTNEFDKKNAMLNGKYHLNHEN